MRFNEVVDLPVRFLLADAVGIAQAIRQTGVTAVYLFQRVVLQPAPLFRHAAAQFRPPCFQTFFVTEVAAQVGILAPAFAWCFHVVPHK